jgi:hypothetical protein
MEYQTLTNESGQYWLDLPPGTYRLKAVLIGFIPLNKNKIEIKENKTTQFDVQLVADTFNSNSTGRSACNNGQKSRH